MRCWVLALVVAMGCGGATAADPGEGSCGPDDPDRDGDGVCDLEDPCPFHNPDDPDGDGKCGVAEDKEPGGDETCEPPEVDLPPQQAGEGQFVPEMLRVELRGIIEDGAWYDTEYQEQQRAARVRFNLYTRESVPVCSVSFDLEESVRPATGSWVEDAPVPLFEAWELIPWADGTTDCPELYPDIFPTNDVRDYLSSFEWGFALGPVLDLGEQLRAVVGDAKWEADYEPYLMSVYITVKNGAPYEVGYALGYEHECGVIRHDKAAGAQVRLPAPTQGPLDGAYEGFEWFDLLLD